MLDDTSREEISQYMELDENSLLSTAGSYLGEPGTMYSREGQLEAGKSAFEQISLPVFEKLCLDWRLCSRLSDKEFADPVKLIASIGHVIAGRTIGIPPLVIATLIFKRDVKKFCNCIARHA